jgi:hypothetical protein
MAVYFLDIHRCENIFDVLEGGKSLKNTLLVDNDRMANFNHGVQDLKELELLFGLAILKVLSAVAE